MSFSNFFAGLVALVGAGAIRWRHRGDKSIAPAYGSAPDIPAARPQGVPTLKMPTARGWTAQRKPTAASGLSVNAFASGLKHPCLLYTSDAADEL